MVQRNIYCCLMCCLTRDSIITCTMWPFNEENHDKLRKTSRRSLREVAGLSYFSRFHGFLFAGIPLHPSSSDITHLSLSLTRHFLHPPLSSSSLALFIRPYPSDLVVSSMACFSFQIHPLDLRRTSVLLTLLLLTFPPTHTLTQTGEHPETRTQMHSH